MTLIDTTGYPVAWPCGASPVTKRQAQRALDEANSYCEDIGLAAPYYVKGVVPEIDRADPDWDGIVRPLSPLEQLARAAEPPADR